jgi:hypothetical protein
MNRSDIFLEVIIIYFLVQAHFTVLRLNVFSRMQQLSATCYSVALSNISIIEIITTTTKHHDLKGNPY